MTNTVRRVAGVALGLCLAAHNAAAQPGNPILDWNQTAHNMIVVPALTAVEQTRAMAIVHVAIHDAVNGITRNFEPYRRGATHGTGSTQAAAIAAAYHALRGIFGHSDPLLQTYLNSLAAYGIEAADPGLTYGEAVASDVLALRENDGAATARYPYLPPNAGAIGVWAPTSAAPAAQAQLPGWGQVTPWVLRSGAQFRPDAPPALESERYARDYNEILAIGRETSATRSGNQTQIALFWRASPTALWNPLLRTAISFRRLGLADAARASALFYLAAADASVACWDAKYFYNTWRPQPAIVNGDLDGNPATTGDPSWRPLLPTPPHPDYVSGHATNSAAMAFVLAALFGDEPGYVIEVSLPNVGFVRRWPSFSTGVREVIDARVYSGIHFRTADEVGARVGRQVAQFVLTHALRPVRGR